jgi:hypothetical protein
MPVTRLLQSHLRWRVQGVDDHLAFEEQTRIAAILLMQ